MNIKKYELRKATVKRWNIDGDAVNSPEKVARFAAEYLNMHELTAEIFSVFALDARLAVVGCFDAGKGNIKSCQVNVGEIAKFALLCNADSVILLHNHPSGGVTPSTADIDSTQKIRDALALFDIGVTDHLIIGENTYFSMRKGGLL